MYDYEEDADYQEGYEEIYNEYTNNTVDRGGQFHLQSAILPVFSQLPAGAPSNFQSKMIREISDAVSVSNPSFDQIGIFYHVIDEIEESKPERLSQEEKKMSLRVIKQECEILSSMMDEPGLYYDIQSLMEDVVLESKYHIHLEILQQMVYVFNLLLSKRLSDSELQESNILAISKGRGALSQSKVFVMFDYKELGMIVIITRELIGWFDQDGLVITTPAILLCLADKVQERFNIQMITDIGSKISPTIYPTWNVTRRIVRWGDNVIDELDNKGYGLLANFESLMISEIIKKEADGFDQGTFQKNIMNDIRESDEKYIEFAEELLKLIEGMSHFHIAQLHGLYRIWGHPEVDSKAGMKKVGDLLHLRKNVDKDLERTCQYTFREVFITNYFSRHGFYPPVEWKALCEDEDEKISDGYHYLRSRITSNLEIDIFSPSYNKNSMKYLVFCQCFTIPTGMNIASFLKDKAVSPSRHDLVDMITMTNRVTDPFRRRGVLKWLSSQPIDIKKMMKAINERSTGLDIDDCTIGLYPKEREMKLEARMFALMSYRMRIYFVMTEEMLSHDVLPYFPQIAMNDNFLTIQKKFVDFTAPMANDSSDKITYIVNIDFKKWNQQMRKEITLGVFSDLGDMYGMHDIYNRTYDIFENSFVYLCNGTYTPTVIGGKLIPSYPLSWEGDIGGKEGLRQKGWTIVSAMDLYAICRDHGFSFKIIGGGDNQVLVINMVRGKDDNFNSHMRMKRFLKDLDEKMKRRGLPLKIGETWVSSSLFAYNKYMIYKGVQLPSTLKLASRCFHLSNSDIMTLENMTKTLAVTYQTIISKDFSCLVGWLFSRLNMAYHIKNIWDHHPFLCKSIPECLKNEVYLSGVNTRTIFKNSLTVTEFYFMALLFPRVLGGSGTISFLSMLSRGFPDVLSEWCAYLYKMEDSNDPVLSKVISKVLLPTKRSMPSYSRLLEDPTSLSLDSAEIGSGAIRNIAKKFLSTTDKISNRGFLKFVEIAQPEDIEELAESLCSNSTIIPREGHDIMGSTIYGYLNSILSKIDKSTTINKLGEGVDVLNMIRNTEVNWINYCGYRLTVEFGMSRETCPTRTAEKWRNESWEKRIVGVTTPHPLAFLKPSLRQQCNGCDGNYIMHCNLFRTGVDKAYEYGGPCNPYLGSYTKEKSLGTELASAYGNEALVRRAVHLQKLIGWRFQRDGPMSSVIKGCLRSVTDVDPDYFSSDPRCVTGDAEHRYKDKATKHEGVINNLYYWSSWVRTITDSFVKHSKGGKNETLQFQTCMLYINSISGIVNDGSQGCILYFDRVKKKSLGIYHFHEVCNQCITPLEDPEEKDVAPRSFPPIPTDPSNPYLFISKDRFDWSYAERKEMEEFHGSTLTESILNYYDGVSALSLLLGARMARVIVGSRHKEEDLTDSTIRLMMGKIEPAVVMTALVNYLFAWKFYTIMTTGETAEGADDCTRIHINARSSLLSEYFSKMLSHNHNIRKMQDWCRSNDLGVQLGDIDIGPVVLEILNRLQINSQRQVVIIYKTRGESLDMKEHIIRTLMSLKYVASSCSECQNYIRQMMKNNRVKWCLCPHSELREALTSPRLVWPEGMESLSKQVSNGETKKPGRPISAGYEILTHHITSFAMLSRINGCQTSVDIKQFRITKTVSNFPMFITRGVRLMTDTSNNGRVVYVLDTYDGKAERLIRKMCNVPSSVEFVRYIRHTRPDYKMMTCYGSHDNIITRMEDIFSIVPNGVQLLLEVEKWDEFITCVNSRHSKNIIFVIQVEITEVVRAVKWLCSYSTGAHVEMSRISDTAVYLVVERFKKDKIIQCYDAINGDTMMCELRTLLGINHHQLYNTWRLSSASARPLDTRGYLMSLISYSARQSEETLMEIWGSVMNLYKWTARLGRYEESEQLLRGFVVFLHIITEGAINERFLTGQLRLRGMFKIYSDAPDPFATSEDEVSIWKAHYDTAGVFDIIMGFDKSWVIVDNDKNCVSLKRKLHAAMVSNKKRTITDDPTEEAGTIKRMTR